MRKVLFMLVMVSCLFGYEKGDRLDQDVIDSLHLQKDRVYILDFFASWCFSCKKEMPLLSKLNDTLDKSRVEIIGIDVDEEPQKGLDFQKDMRSKGLLNFKVHNDFKGKIVNRFEPVGFPAVYVIKDLKVVSMKIGAKEGIDKLLLDEIKDLK